MLGQGYQFPLDLRGEIAQDRFVGGVDAQGRSSEEQARC